MTIGFPKIRRPTGLEIALQSFFLLLLAIHLPEFFNALGAESCFDRTAASKAHCYPWGMKEGPMEGGSWNYENKDVYVRSALMGSLVAGAAIIAPFFATGRWTGLAALMIGFVGYRHLEWLTSLI